MKKIIILWLSIGYLSGCIPRKDDILTTNYTPVLMERAAMEAAVRTEPPRTLVNTGKLYKYREYLFISELFEGIHVINNANPLLPKKIGFIRIPGCVDMAVKDGYLYADNATDLITFNLNNPENPTMVHRVKDVFPELLPPDHNMADIPSSYSKNERPENTVIVKWQR